MSILYTNEFALFFFVIPFAQWFLEASPLTCLVLFLIRAGWMLAILLAYYAIRSRPLILDPSMDVDTGLKKTS